MLTNEQMKPGRFAKLARGRRIFRKMTAVWDAGGVVWLSTMTRRTKIAAKHRACVKMDTAGSLYVQAGKRWDCIDFCGIGYTAR